MPVVLSMAQAYPQVRLQFWTLSCATSASPSIRRPASPRRPRAAPHGRHRDREVDGLGHPLRQSFEHEPDDHSGGAPLKSGEEPFLKLGSGSAPASLQDEARKPDDHRRSVGGRRVFVLFSHLELTPRYTRRSYPWVRAKARRSATVPRWA